MSISEIGSGWANNTINDLPDRNYLYNKPSEEMTFTGTFWEEKLYPCALVGMESKFISSQMKGKGYG